MKRRSFSAALGVCALPFVGCLGAPTNESGTSPTSGTEHTTSRGSEPGSTPEYPSEPGSTPEYPTEPGARLGEATAAVHPRRRLEFTDDVAALRCTCVAADAVRDRVSDHLDRTRGISVGCGVRPDIEGRPREERGFGVIVHHTTTFGRDGERQETPAVDYDRVLAVTPRTASATIVSDGREHECTVPVYVLREEAHVD